MADVQEYVMAHNQQETLSRAESITASVYGQVCFLDQFVLRIVQLCTDATQLLYGRSDWGDDPSSWQKYRLIAAVAYDICSIEPPEENSPARNTITVGQNNTDPKTTSNRKRLPPPFSILLGAVVYQCTWETFCPCIKSYNSRLSSGISQVSVVKSLGLC
ncbi:Hypothetical predicted protein [Pelobates cultripes]|uniref:Uncharacterized protein n=1 Tax=Pelobates cultripes TaxID=61616 RepID=A0AAD1T7Q7_PELCU|nr:Hypothetical predicted protein [Pelobates cultripes]